MCSMPLTRMRGYWMLRSFLYLDILWLFLLSFRPFDSLISKRIRLNFLKYFPPNLPSAYGVYANTHHPSYHDTRLYNTLTIWHIFPSPTLCSVDLPSYYDSMLIIQHFLDPICHMIEVINVHIKVTPTCISRFICDLYTGTYWGTLWAYFISTNNLSCSSIFIEYTKWHFTLK